MTSFTFSAEQLKAAPPEVRHWVLAQIEPELLGLSAPAAPSSAHAATLAVCTPDEAAKIFELIRPDFAAVQVLLELAREMPGGNGGRPLHVIRIPEIIRHTRLDGDRVSACLRLIDEAFREVRGTPDTSLFGSDQAHHVYMHEGTYRSMRAVWEALMRPRAPEMFEPQPQSPDFVPPRLGPNENVAAHASNGQRL